MLRAVVLLLVLALPLALAAAPSDHRTYVGPITHDLVYKPGAFATIYRTLYGSPSCHGSGVATLHVDLARGTMEIVNPDDRCLPGWSTLSQGCRLDADGHVRCARDVGNDRIRLDVAPDGHTVFTWDAASFQERIEGTLVRVS